MRCLLVRHPAILATLAVVLALLLHGAIVGAEEPRIRLPRDLVAEPYLRVDETLPLAALGAAADWWSTEHLLDAQVKGVYEANPFGPSVGKRGAMQLVHIGATVGLVHQVDRRYGRKWGKRTLWLITAGKGFIAARHMWLARQYDIPLFPPKRLN